jgi:hypothetical protein
MEIINKSGIDALISARDTKNNSELRVYKENLSNVIIEFSKLQTELENILNTFEYLEEHKLNKVVNNIVYDVSQKVEHNKHKKVYKNRCVIRIEHTGSKNKGISIEYIKTDEVSIKFSFFPFKGFNHLRINTKNFVEFEISIDYKNGKTIFNGTESVTKIIHTNFGKEVEMVIDDYKYIIEMFINALNKINDGTKFE